ncbi:dTMP kinase [Helicobacter sp. MIT 05-5294]|uniref:dTMP kinase n=1 Tax=Helicobacter sp. MIT 05-5294 TaxID=1548150 RepID=UPI00051FBE13|nr:dTMP kinase [Helicobacter sp. MIT 05-5294]TLD85866.1 dTMP kinase [Helicobacter sp. MIT 05-5294]
MYCVIEGIDTSGKSTQIRALKEIYKQAVFTFEPGATEVGKEIRRILLEQNNFHLSAQTEVLLFLADRAEHSAQVLQPNLNRLIISDRSLISGIAYAKDFDFGILKSLNLFATRGILPNKVVLLELNQEVLEARLGAKSEDKIESRGIAYLLELQERLGVVIEGLGIESLRIPADLPQATITARIVDFINA